MRHRPVDQARPRRRTSAITSIRVLRRATTCKERCETSIVFVHISKSAGSTMKKALADAARRTNRRPPITLFRRTWPRFLAACAKGRAACRADLYAGTNAFGACEYVEAAARRRGEDRRCVYATVLRNPIDRVESSWRYFCLNGAERRKGWTMP